MILVLNNSEIAPKNCVELDVTSRSLTWARTLSPFLLEGGKTWTGDFARNVENLYQYSKVYRVHVDKNDDPNEDWLRWAKAGWNTKLGIRYPMGKEAVPLYSYWNGKKLGYLEAKEKLYVKMYFRSVRKTDAYKKLEEVYKECLKSGKTLVLRDFDSYNHIKLGMSAQDVLKNEHRKFGHGFVLMFMLMGLLDDDGNFRKKDIPFF